MTWTTNKLLLAPSEYTAPKEIFQAVCDEIGQHYSQLGHRYARSRPKVTIKTNGIKLEINFWSLRSNIAGKNITLQILPYFYSLKLAKQKGENGLFLGNRDLFIHKNKSDNPKLIKVRQIYGDVLERIEKSAKESIVKENNSCNIYGIDETKFNQIIAFIDAKIIYWLERLESEAGILELTADLPKKNPLTQKSFNAGFIRYVQTTFPQIDIKERLKYKK